MTYIGIILEHFFRIIGSLSEMFNRVKQFFFKLTVMLFQADIEWEFSQQT